MEKRSEAQAKLKIISSMAAFGTLGIFVRHIPLASGELALYRAVIAFAALAAWQLISGKGCSYGDIKEELPWLFASGAAIGINWILFFEAYRYTTVAMATLSYYFSPILVTAASAFLFKERMTGRQLLCFVMSTLGLGLVIGVSSGTGNKDLIGILFGLGAAVFYAFVVLCNKHITKVSGIHRTMLQFFGAIVILLPYVALTGGFHLTELEAAGVLNLLAVGVFHTGVCYYLYLSSLHHLSGQEASILSYIDPLTAIVVSVAILREPITMLQAVGGFMILGFAILNELKPAARECRG